MGEGERLQKVRIRRVIDAYSLPAQICFNQNCSLLQNSLKMAVFMGKPPLSRERFRLLLEVEMLQGFG